MKALATLALALPLLAAKSDPLAGRVAGTPQQCVSLNSVSGPDIVNGSTILYRENARRIWRTKPVGGCPGLRPLTRLIVDVRGSDICRNDRFRTLDVNSTIPGAYCRFGDFTPFDKR